MSEQSNPRRVKTENFRMSFPYLLETREGDDGRKTYQLTMLYPPGSDLKPLNAAMKAAMVEKYGADNSKWPKLRRGPKDVLRDFAEYNAETKKPLAGDWTGWTMVRCSASEKFPPGIVGPTKNANGKFPIITDAREIYGGRWARATLDAYVYERKDGKGVTFGLQNVQLLKHDTKFGGAVSAPESDFDDAEADWVDDGDAFEKGEATAGNKADDADDWN